MHHHIKNHGRGGAFYSYIGFQLHNAIWFASHQPNRSHVIKRKTCYCEFVEPDK